MLWIQNVKSINSAPIIMCSDLEPCGLHALQEEYVSAVG